jgi:hypothetical protein
MGKNFQSERGRTDAPAAVIDDEAGILRCLARTNLDGDRAIELERGNRHPNPSQRGMFLPSIRRSTIGGEVEYSAGRDVLMIMPSYGSPNAFGSRWSNRALICLRHSSVSPSCCKPLTPPLR